MHVRLLTRVPCAGGSHILLSRAVTAVRGVLSRLEGLKCVSVLRGRALAGGLAETRRAQGDRARARRRNVHTAAAAGVATRPVRQPAPRRWLPPPRARVCVCVQVCACATLATQAADGRRVDAGLQTRSLRLVRRSRCGRHRRPVPPASEAVCPHSVFFVLKNAAVANMSAFLDSRTSRPAGLCVVHDACGGVRRPCCGARHQGPQWPQPPSAPDDRRSAAAR
jgi:hypothetical protein